MLSSKLIVYTRHGEDTSVYVIKLENTLQKIAAHPDLVDGVESKYHGEKTAKLQVIKNIVRAVNGKIVIFTSHHELVPILAEFLEEFEVFAYTKQNDKAIVDKFEQKNGQAILITTHMLGGTGKSVVVAFLFE